MRSKFKLEDVLNSFPLIPSYFNDSYEESKGGEVVEEKQQTPETKPTQQSENEKVPSNYSQGSEIDLLRQSCLKAHNDKRALHGALPLTLSNELNTAAQKWADHLGKSGKFQHSSGTGFGENLAGHSKFDINSGRLITDLWYNEINKYNFLKQGFSMGTGHFTQVVWKSTTEMGVGVAKNTKSGMWVYVANYKPPGNMLGTFEQNVSPPI